MQGDSGMSSMIRVASVAQAVADATHAEAGLHAVVQTAYDLFDAQTVAVILQDDEGARSHIKLARGLSAGFISGFSRSLSSGVIAEVLHGGTPLRISDAAEAQEVVREIRLEHDFGSAMAVGMTINRRPLGYLHIDHARRGSFEKSHLHTARCLGCLAALALEKVRLQDVVARLSIQDSMTGLSTYSRFYARLSTEIERVLRYEESLAVLLLDITNLNYVEDVYGRAGARELLRHVAGIVRENIRGVDFAARFRTDTFMVCLVKAHEAAARDVAERIITACHTVSAVCPAPGAKEEAAGEIIPLEVVIGASLVPAHGRTASVAIAEAEKALLAARRMGVGSIVIATP